MLNTIIMTSECLVSNLSRKQIFHLCFQCQGGGGIASYIELGKSPLKNDSQSIDWSCELLGRHPRTNVPLWIIYPSIPMRVGLSLHVVIGIRVGLSFLSLHVYGSRIFCRGTDCRTDTKKHPGLDIFFLIGGP